MTLVWILVIAVVVVLGIHLYTLHQLSKLRRAGVYPKRGHVSSTDVERLIKGGFPVLAIRCYREINGCSLRQAREAVQILAGKS